MYGFFSFTRQSLKIAGSKRIRQAAVPTAHSVHLLANVILQQSTITGRNQLI
jgi:hypothetical protein